LIEQRLQLLCDLTTDAHTRIQQDFKNIDPIVGVSQHMRNNGIPADVMTIDCLRSGKRIIIVLHDEQPDTISYQFSFKDKDPDIKFNQIPSADLTADAVYDWIGRYFK